MKEHFNFFLTSFVLAASITFLGWRQNFFRITTPPLLNAQLPSVRNIAGAFALFLSIELFFIPSLAGGYILWKKEGMHLSTLAQGWISFLAIFLSSLGVLFYALVLPAPKRNGLFWGGNAKGTSRFLKDFFNGIFTWLISYPWVLVMGHLVALIMLQFGPLSEMDQVAVKQFKLSQQNPALFISMLLAIIFLVPLAEEILFRGFLQRGFRAFLAPWQAICLTSIVFALFHFSTTQGWNNIELILSLFILSCYLGFIYEKWGSIWAPMGLHMAFNAISISLIMLQEGG